VKLKAPDTAAVVTARSPINWFLGICLAAFMTAVSASNAVAQTDAGGLNPAEEWVVAQVTSGKEANLSTQFSEKEKRKLSARFLEELLVGALPGAKPHRNGVQIFGAIIDEPIDLKDAQIPCVVWLHDCQFNKSVIFDNASFMNGVSFGGSTFKADASFFSVKVGRDALFVSAVFEGPVFFIGADIATDFIANGAKFQNKEEEADFSSMKVGHDAVLIDAVFERPVFFTEADIGRDFVATGAKFQNKEKEADFSSMKVGHDADFKNAIFEGPTDFVGADIASYFDATGTKFQSKKQEASFSRMKVEGTADFKDAVFEGPVDFIEADIDRDFDATGTKFQNKQQTASFNGMKVRGAAGFKDAVFEGPVNFSYADFAWLDLSSPFWPKVPALFRMQGMSYKYIRAAPGNEPDSHKALLKLADQSAYSADVYSSLQAFFLRQGYRDDADQAFIDRKRRERKEYLHGFGWIGSWLLDLLVGYGRRPWQAGIPCAVLVALGWVLFSPKKMEPQRPEDARQVYNRFWYSLGLFLPFVDLQVATLWKPKADQTFLRNYMRVHILLGWILIPLVLAALTGLIK
jgi:uncharacterized protein YjbI with pentapeptide repeats